MPPSTFQFKFINANIEPPFSSVMSRPNTLLFMTSIPQFSLHIFLILHYFQLDFKATNFSIYITLHIETQITVRFMIHNLYDANQDTHFPRTTAAQLMAVTFFSRRVVRARALLLRRRGEALPEENRPTPIEF